ncbi:MAG: PAS domain S-box protein [Methanoregula sp.]
MTFSFQYSDILEIIGALLRVASFVAVAVVIAYLSVILEKKQQAYRSVSKFNEGIVSNANVWLAVLDAGGNILVWNKAAEEISGYSRDEVVGKNTIWKLIYPDTTYRKEIAGTIAHVTREKRFFENFVSVIRTKNGGKKTILWNTRAIPDEKGSLRWYVAIGIDITERKAAEEELRGAYEQLTAQEEELRHQYGELEKGQHALAESEAEYRDILRTAMDGFCIVDKTGAFLDMNDAFCKMLGYSREEMLSLSLRSIEDVESPEDIAYHTKEIIRKGEDRFETRYRCKDGRIMDAEVSVVFSGSQSGHFIAFHRDITERKKIEDYITKLSALKVQLLDHRSLDSKLRLITDCVVTIFGADFARIWIIKEGDLCEKGCIHAGVTEGPHVCRSRTSCLHLIASSGRYTHIDGDHRRVPLGSYKIGRVATGDDPGFITNDVVNDARIHDPAWARSLGLVAFAGFKLMSAENRPIGVIALFRKRAIGTHEKKLIEDLANTTAQVIQTGRIEDALRENEERYRTLFEGAAEGILVADAMTAKFLYANSAICRMLGYSESELTSMSLAQLHPDGDLDYVTKEFKALAIGIKTSSTGIPCMRKDKTIVYMDILTSRLSIDGKRCIVGFFTDITERRRAEVALDQTTKKLSMLNSITFADIQNEIFSLRGYLELGKTVPMDEKLRGYLDKQIRIVNTISESLKFANSYQGLGSKPPAWQNVMQSFLMGISHVDVSSLSRRLDVEGLEIYADLLLENVFFTLVENVVIHGTTATEIRLFYQKHADGLTLVFENDGVGISQDMKEKIFERRFEEKKGLGLFLAREILGITGMTIKETGESGKGARFEIIVPEGAYRFADKP